MLPDCVERVLRRDIGDFRLQGERMARRESSLAYTDPAMFAAEIRRDPRRLVAVRSAGLLDTEAEEAFDRLTRLAVRLTDIPAAFISLVDENRDFYKSACGFGEPLATTRQLEGPTFCHFTIQSDQPLIIPDTAGDPRYRDVPTVRTLGVAAYVGIPLVIDGQVIGAFCAIDVAPRAWTSRDVSTLAELAGIALHEIQFGIEKRRNETLRTAAERDRTRMADLFRRAPAFIAVVRGPDHVFELANDEYCRLVGRNALVGRPLVDVLPEVREQGVIELLDRVTATHQPYVGTDVPIQLQRAADGLPELRFVNFVYQPLDQSDSAPHGVLLLGVDVTDQRTARNSIETLNQQLQERATDLARAEARYRVLAQAVPVHVWTATPDGSLDFVSEQAATYFGVPSSEALGSGWVAFVHPDDVELAGARWASSLRQGTPYQTEFRLRNGAGEYRWFLARALPNRDDDGLIVGWIGSNTDVEGERRARTDAENANRSKSEFLAMMSHELRTPLNAIGGYAELLETEVRGPISPTQRHDLERIRRSQRHLLSLINGILNYAKLDAGAITYVVDSVPLDEVLASCEALTMPQARTKGVSLEIARPMGVRASADREKVEQVLLNLLSNAIKFTDAGGRVSVSYEEHGRDVRLHVADTGCGIPPEHVNRVFDPFVQLDASLTRDQPGTGLGLAISRELARGMSGSLSAASKVGVGSTFTLTLPRDDA